MKTRKLSVERMKTHPKFVISVGENGPRDRGDVVRE